MSDIFHAVGEVLGGPSTQKRVNPQTGVIEEVPLSRSGRIANTIGIYARGAAAGAAQHGPGAVGKAALAGSQEQQQTQQQQTENTLAESKNVQSQLEAQDRVRYKLNRSPNLAFAWRGSAPRWTRRRRKNSIPCRTCFQ